VFLTTVLCKHIEKTRLNFAGWSRNGVAIACKGKGLNEQRENYRNWMWCFRRSPNICAHHKTKQKNPRTAALKNGLVFRSCSGRWGGWSPVHSNTYIIFVFVFGATVPSVPGPPNSRGL